MKTQALVILHNIRSAHNVGSLFRTADAAGVEKIYLVGYTPTPVDRFGRTQKEIAKTALGAENTVAWEHVERIEACIDALKKEGFTIIAVEQSDNSIPYTKIARSKKMAFILGNEPNGIPHDVLDLCDSIAEIPMYGEKESLNVSVAAGVVLYAMLH